MDLRIRYWESLDFYDPVPVLLRLRAVEIGQVPLPYDPAKIPARVLRLRTNELKPFREARDAAIFSHGLATALGTKVFYAPVEDADYDFVVSFVLGDTRHFSPVQLKEVHPEDLDPNGSLEALIAKLGKYGPTDTILVIKYNRRERIELDDLRAPDIPFSEAWLFASTSADGNSYLLIGDLRGEPVPYEFAYPSE